jgi:3-deoxy-7-phosphoheptulonate synthase
MIILLKKEASKADADIILNKISDAGLKPLYMPGTERILLGAIGDERVLEGLHFDSYPIVEKVTPILTAYKMVSRDFQKEDSVISIGGVKLGGGHLAVISGPCAIESYEQLYTTAVGIKESGGTILRGGAFKPRTSPYSFQGLGVEGLKILNRVSQEVGLPTVTEIVDICDVDSVEEYADAFQIGARNMQNYRLLQAVGKRNKPVILKRGLAATVDDLLMSAEYIASEGNTNIILCERGIRTFETATRNTLDLNAVPYLKQHCHLPVIVDPSHGTGVRELVQPMAAASVAAGADGIMIETHCNPTMALSDGKQSLDLEQFEDLMVYISKFVDVVGKEMQNKS